MNELPEFPSFLRPMSSYSYNHSGQNLIYTNVSGGSSRASVDYCTEKVIFDVSFIMKSYYEMQVFNDFYFNTTFQGTRKFNMKLRPTGPLEDHVCLIVPGSLSVTGGGFNAPFLVTMQIEAERINAPFDGQLYNLAAGGYVDLPAYFDRIEQFANFDLA